MFPQSMKPELSYLAHNLVEIDKYRVETCCVIGKHWTNEIRGHRLQDDVTYASFKTNGSFIMYM